MTADQDDEFVFNLIRAGVQESLVEGLAVREMCDISVAGTRVHNALVRLRSAGRIRSKTVHEVVK